MVAAYYIIIRIWSAYAYTSTSIGKNKIIDTIAFIPIYIKPVGRIMSKLHSYQSLDAQIKAYEEERKQTYFGLVTRHEWTESMITQRTNEVGYEELREEYLDLENKLKIF